MKMDFKFLAELKSPQTTMQVQFPSFTTVPTYNVTIDCTYFGNMSIPIPPIPICNHVHKSVSNDVKYDSSNIQVEHCGGMRARFTYAVASAPLDHCWSTGRSGTSSDTDQRVPCRRTRCSTWCCADRSGWFLSPETCAWNEGLSKQLLFFYIINGNCLVLRPILKIQYGLLTNRSPILYRKKT